MALTMKRITDLQEKTEISDDDLIAVGNAGTASLRKTKWSTFWNNILTKIRGTIIVNNKVTTVEGYALDARMGKDFQKQIDDLNTKLSKQEPFYWSGNATFGADGLAVIPCDKNVKVCSLLGAPIMHGEFLSFTFAASNGKIRCGGLSGTQPISGTVWLSVIGFVEYI